MAEEKSDETLTPAQQRVAELIRNRAVELGVNPRLALALAYRENKFTNNPGGLDEIGIMQVRPGTAKQYGFNPKDLTDETKNIDIGLQILKKHLDRFQGYPNTAVMAAAAYNAGPDHPFFTNPKKNPLPESTQAYLRDINSLKGFESYTQTGTEQEGDETKEPSLREKAGKLFADAKGIAAQAAEEYPEAVRAGLDVGGLLAGRKLGAGSEELRKGFQTAAAQTPAAQPLPAGQLPAAAPSSILTPGQPPAPIPTDPMHTRQIQGTTDGGATGKARQTTFNTATAQQSAATKQQEELMRQLQRRGVITDDAKSVLAKAPGLTATPSGVLLPSSQVYADIPPTQGTSATPPPAPPAQPPKAPLSSRVSRGVNIGFRAMPKTTGALAGLGAAEMGQEAYQRAQSGDIPGALIAGAGAAGSAASLLPFPQTRVGGPAIAAVSPLTLLLYDKAKERAIRQAQGYGALAAGRQLPAPSIYQGYFGP